MVLYNVYEYLCKLDIILKSLFDFFGLGINQKLNIKDLLLEFWNWSKYDKPSIKQSFIEVLSHCNPILDTHKLWDKIMHMTQYTMAAYA